jgi:hypothetical protein
MRPVFFDNGLTILPRGSTTLGDIPKEFIFLLVEIRQLLNGKLYILPFENVYLAGAAIGRGSEMTPASRI